MSTLPIEAFESCKDDTGRRVNKTIGLENV